MSSEEKESFSSKYKVEEIQQGISLEEQQLFKKCVNKTTIEKQLQMKHGKISLIVLIKNN